MIRAKLRSITHSRWFLTTSGSLAMVGWFLKDEFPQDSRLHMICVGLVGLGIFLGTWSTTTRTPSPAPTAPPEGPKC